jgi:hypothetical protein
MCSMYTLIRFRIVCKIGSSHGGEAEDSGLLGCDTVSL